MRWPSRHRSKVQSRRFHDAMVGVYERVSAACPGYRLTAFLAMTRDRGGLTAARALLHPERGVSEGLGDERDVSQRSLAVRAVRRSEEHTSELQSPCNLVCRLLLEKKKTNYL